MPNALLSSDHMLVCQAANTSEAVLNAAIPTATATTMFSTRRSGRSSLHDAQALLFLLMSLLQALRRSRQTATGAS
jgi:predicted permease